VVFEKVLPILCLCELGGQSEAQVEAGFAKRRSEPLSSATVPNARAPQAAETWDGMVKAMTRHVMEKHPDVAKAMEAMHKEDSKRSGREMKPKWEAAPQA
jgi:hypothetical protein